MLISSVLLFLEMTISVFGCVMFPLPSHTEQKYHVFPLLIFRHSKGMFLLIQDNIVLSGTLYWG